MQFGAFHVQIDFHDFLCIVPSPASVSHEYSLVEAKNSDRNQVADEKERLDKRERQCGKEHRQKDKQHALLGVLRANLDDRAAVLFGGAFVAGIEVNILFDKRHSSVCPGRYRLDRGPREPVNDGAPGNQPQQERGVKQ